MAAGRCKSAATSIGLRPRSLISRASLPQVVVLPEPCRPHIISTVTSGLQMQRVIDRAHQVDAAPGGRCRQLAGSGLSDLSTCSPMACSLTLAMKSLTTG